MGRQGEVGEKGETCRHSVCTLFYSFVGPPGETGPCDCPPPRLVLRGVGLRVKTRPLEARRPATEHLPATQRSQPEPRLCHRAARRSPSLQSPHRHQHNHRALAACVFHTFHYESFTCLSACSQMSRGDIASRLCESAALVEFTLSWHLNLQRYEHFAHQE